MIYQLSHLGELLSPAQAQVNVCPVLKVAFVLVCAEDIVGISVKMLNLARKRKFYDKPCKKKLGLGKSCLPFIVGLNPIH